MLFRHRRFLALLVFLLLASPMVCGIVAPDSPASVLKEGRIPAPVPNRPRSWNGLIALPGQVDAYLKDHFGFRQTMVHTLPFLFGNEAVLDNLPFLFGNESVLVGRSGRMFFLGDEMVRQSGGLILRDEKVADAAYMLAAMRDALARRGIRFLVTVPPNSSTIYQDYLPIWAQRGRRKTEYDLFLEDLAARDVKAIDLRPALMAAREEGRVYRMNDSHWTERGALAAFNAVVEADGHPDWRLDPATALGPPAVDRVGDLARLLGVQDYVTESNATFALAWGGENEPLSKGLMPDRVVTSAKPGPTIMVIGDSFTFDYFTIMLMQRAKRAIWLNHQRCGFDWKWIDKFHPDEVWWAPTERFLICKPGAHPIDFAGLNEPRAQ
jgi:alginate O-acetyltransferase complex protein AlgJ